MLNTLLANLHIPITLETPLDLTPSLVLALFESTLRTRLPLPHATRLARTHKGKVEAMKIVLGVLEDDVLGVDVGLENVDPRRLAEGREEEVRYVGEVLCWLGRKTGYLDELSMEDDKPKMEARGESSRSPGQRSRRKTRAAVDAEDVFGPVRKPNTMSPSIASTSLDSSLLIHSHSADDSHTAMSLHDALHEDDGLSVTSGRNLDDFSILQPHRDANPGRTGPVHDDFPLNDHPLVEPDETIDLDEVTAFLDSRAHGARNQSHSLSHSHSATPVGERETPRRPIRVPSRRYDDETDSESGQEESIEESFCRCTPKELPPVRTTGYIDTVDFEEELKSFEAQKWSQKTPASAHLSRSSRTRFQVSAFRVLCSVIRPALLSQIAHVRIGPGL